MLCASALVASPAIVTSRMVTSTPTVRTEATSKSSRSRVAGPLRRGRRWRSSRTWKLNRARQYPKLAASGTAARMRPAVHRAGRSEGRRRGARGSPLPVPGVDPSSATGSANPPPVASATSVALRRTAGHSPTVPLARVSALRTHDARHQVACRSRPPAASSTTPVPKGATVLTTRHGTSSGSGAEAAPSSSTQPHGCSGSGEPVARAAELQHHRRHQDEPDEQVLGQQASRVQCRERLGDDQTTSTAPAAHEGVVPAARVA
jgi:hypothetical protein